MAQNWEISNDAIRVAAVTFSNKVFLNFELDSGLKKADIVDKLNKAPYKPGSTATGTVLKQVRETLLKKVRPGVPVTVILFTDGRSNDRRFDCVEQAQLLKAAGAKLISIGVTKFVNARELNAMSSEGKHIFIDDFDQISNFAQMISQKACDSSGGGGISPPTGEDPPSNRKEPCICSAAGDPHFSTYDKQMIHYFGVCKYTLTKYAGSKKECHFDVEVKNEIRGVPGPSYVRLVDIKMCNSVYRLHQGNKVYVNNVETPLPYSGSCDTQIFYSGLVVQFVSTSCDVSITFNGVSNVVVQVGGRYSNLLSGICGNCNGVPDDFKTKDGKDVSSDPNKFNLIGDSYQVAVDDSDHPETCKASEPLPSVFCKTPAEKETIMESSKNCAAHKSQVSQLKTCATSGKINFLDWKSSCEMDLCLNAELMKSNANAFSAIKCEIIQNLVETCEHAGFPNIDWREQYGCAVKCGPNSRYSHLGDPCPLTCNDMNLGFGGKKTCFFQKKREGCVCNLGYVLDNTNNCVPVTSCLSLGGGMKGSYKITVQENGKTVEESSGDWDGKMNGKFGFNLGRDGKVGIGGNAQVNANNKVEVSGNGGGFLNNLINKVKGKLWKKTPGETDAVEKSSGASGTIKKKSHHKVGKKSQAVKTKKSAHTV